MSQNNWDRLKLGILNFLLIFWLFGLESMSFFAYDFKLAIEFENPTWKFNSQQWLMYCELCSNRHVQLWGSEVTMTLEQALECSQRKVYHFFSNWVLARLLSFLKYEQTIILLIGSKNQSRNYRILHILIFDEKTIVNK